MPPSDNRSSSSRLPFGSFRRAIFSVRPDQVHSLEPVRESPVEDSGSLSSFHRLVSTRFSDLSTANDEEFLSIPWIRKLLDAFGDCHDSFRTTLWNNGGKDPVTKPPHDKNLSDYFDTSIKALDLCNAARDGIQKMRVWQGHLEIVVSALDPEERRMIGEGHFRRARKALTDLTLVLVADDKDFSSRNRSFGQHNRAAKDHSTPSPRHSRSLSWSVSPSWSASKQLQLIANNLLHLPTPASTNALATLTFTMGHVLLCILWALVAAIPCQDRGGAQVPVPVPIPAQFVWARPLQAIHLRIADRSKKRDRRNTNGSLKETGQVENGVHQLLELIHSGERREEAMERAEKLSRVCKVYQTELGPLERQLRDMFRKIMTCRAEGLEILGKATEP